MSRYSISLTSLIKKYFRLKELKIRDDLVSCVLVNRILGVLPRCKIEE